MIVRYARRVFRQHAQAAGHAEMQDQRARIEVQ
jgi:hypothetical protein